MPAASIGGRADLNVLSVAVYVFTASSRALALKPVSVARSGANYGATDEQAAEEFRLATERFEFKIDPYGRQPKNPRGAVLDFELEYTRLRSTPDAILDALYWDLGSGSCSLGEDTPIWKNLSPWWSIATDGGSVRRQAPGNEINGELTTAAFVSPEEVLESGFIPSIEEIINKTTGTDDPIHGVSGVAGTTGPWPWKWMALQYTVGLPLEQMYTLMRYSAAHYIWERTEAQCGQQPTMYKAVVALAAMTAEGVSRHLDGGMCIHAKRYLYPWLVRTHHGDMVMYAREHLGDAIFTTFKEDVLTVSQAGPVAFVHGVIDYLHVPEVAEVAGLVRPRNGINPRVGDPETRRKLRNDSCYLEDPPHKEHTHFPLVPDALTAMPRTRQGVCKLIQLIIKHQKGTAEAVCRLGCGLYFADGVVQPLQAATPSEWLDGILKGRDVWTDPENPHVQASSSKLVFKSMGRWRMRAGYVYLECHNQENKCLGNYTQTRFADDPVGLKIAEVAREVQQLMRKM